MPPAVHLRYLNAAHFLTHYLLMVFPTAVLAVELDWRLPYGEALALSTPAFVAFALATLPAGMLGDRLPREHLIVAFFVGGGAACGAIALAPSPAWLMAGMAALGLFAAVYHPVGIALVTGLYTRRGRALAVNGVCGNLGLAAASLGTGLMCEWLGWRAAFALPGLACLLVGLLYHRRVRRAAAAAPDAGSDPGTAAPERPARAPAPWRVLAFIAIAALLGGLVFNALSQTLPKLLSEGVGWLGGDVARVGTASALVFAVAAVAQLPVGWLLDGGLARVTLVTLLAAEVAVLSLVAHAEGAALVACLTVLVFLVYGEAPVSAWLVGRFVPAAWHSRVFAVEYVLSLGTTAAVVPMVALLHAAGFGLQRQYLGLAVAVAVVLLSVALLPRRGLGRAAPAGAAGDRAGSFASGAGDADAARSGGGVEGRTGAVTVSAR